jgi:hypothetical protein
MLDYSVYVGNTIGLIHKESNIVIGLLHIALSILSFFINNITNTQPYFSLNYLLQLYIYQGRIKKEFVAAHIYCTIL